MLRNLLLFAQRFVNARTGRQTGFYWNNAPPQEIASLVALLSNTEIPERQEIRRALHHLEPHTLLDIACGPAIELSFRFRVICACTTKKGFGITGIVVLGLISLSKILAWLGMSGTT